VSGRRPSPLRAAAVPACLCLAGLSLAACGKGGPGGGGYGPSGPAEVVVQIVHARPLEVTDVLPGRTSPFESSDVRPQVGGLIQSRPFTEGADVRAGQLLYQIDPAPYRAALDQARGALAGAQAAEVTAKAKAGRYADLVKINAVSRQDYDDAAAAAAQDAAAVQQQKAAVEAAQVNLAYTRITAPIAGRIGRSTVTRGALVTPGQAGALTTIQRLDPIYVDLTEPAAQAVRLRAALASGAMVRGGPDGARVRLALEDGTVYPLEGRLQFTEVTVDQATGQVTLRAVFPNPKGLLLPGLFVRATVVEGIDPKGVLVPQLAVQRDEKGRAIAYVVDAQSRAQPRVVTTAEAVGDQWRVVSGLAEGDRLIVEGLMAVKPGGPVRVAQSR
jgi:membrane fusion protein, multidrug efflux system